mmetsp:Transcript_17156/g.37526  ORF Transcript_17156/g.37526 Transcript_17156/m.37526 type:complete len:135 (-) Transcript_17156:302-706(-)
MSSFPVRSVFVFFVVLISITTVVVNGIDTCTSEYCICIGDCPPSYTDSFSSLSSIFNGEENVCYATNDVKFNIGGDSIKIGDDMATTSDLKPCPDEPSTTIAAMEESETSSAASCLSLSVVTAVIIGGLGWTIV